MLRQFIDNEDGQGLIEYVLILSLVAMIVIAVLTLLGLQTNNYYNKIVNDTAGPFGG